MQGKDFLRLFFVLLTLFVMLAFIWHSTTIDHEAENFKSLLSIDVIGLAISTVLFVISLKKFLTQKIKKLISSKFAIAFHFISIPFVKLSNKIRDLFGWYKLGNGNDEKSFVFDERNKIKKLKKLKNDQKWADQTDNRMKIRFLFIDFMIRKIKNGYKMVRNETPAEMKEDAAIDYEEELMFDTYQLARYDIHSEISDETVGLLLSMNRRKSK